MTTLAPVPGTGVTKGSLVETAYEYCALAGYEFERAPEEMASGIRQLAMMMMERPFSLCGFNTATAGFGQPEEGSNLLNEDVPAVGYCLALRIATIMGKMLPKEFFIMANPSMYAFKARYTVIPQQDYRPGTIRDQGSTEWRNWSAFFPEPEVAGDIVDIGL